MKYTKEFNDDIEVSEGDGLFDGSYYEGERAVAIGLADAIDSMENWVSSKYGDGDDKVQVVTKQIKGASFPSFLPFGNSALLEQKGTTVNHVADQIASSIYEKLSDEMVWAPYNCKVWSSFC